MDGMLLETNTLTLAEVASSLGDLLKEHNGQDVAVLDVRKFQIWTDFFIIATVTSSTHMDGLDRHINEYCRERGIEIRSSFRKNRDDQWRLIDLSLTSGSIVIHLMASAAREFYELERLWTA